MLLCQMTHRNPEVKKRLVRMLKIEPGEGRVRLGSVRFASGASWATWGGSRICSKVDWWLDRLHPVSEVPAQRAGARVHVLVHQPRPALYPDISYDPASLEPHLLPRPQTQHLRDHNPLNTHSDDSLTDQELPRKGGKATTAHSPQHLHPHSPH